MKAACTMYRGNAKEAFDAAKQLQGVVPSKYMEMGGGMGNYMQYAHSTPVMMQIRFGWWDSLLAAPRLNSKLKYAWAIQTFGKGMAWCRKGNVQQAQAMLNDLKGLENDASLKEQFETINPAIKGLGVMISLLQGTIAWQNKDIDAAIAAYQEAVKREDGFMYQEPRDWLLPTRHYLGAALLARQNFADAEMVYQTELVINPRNVWSLYGLYQSQSGLKKESESTKTRKLLLLATEGADIKLTGSAM
jgi:tetratricopeptide (TPR) repeat protein